MTVRTGQRRSAAEADAADIPRSRERPDDAAAREWAAKLAALSGDPPPLAVEPVEKVEPSKARQFGRAWLSRLPGWREWAFVLAIMVPVMWIVAHEPESAPAPAPDKPASLLPPRAVAPDLPDPAASGVVVLDNGRASSTVDSLTINTTPDLAALTANAPGDFYWSVRYPKVGFLSELNIVHFDAHTDLGDIDGRPDPVRYQLEKAYAAIVLQKGAVLTCGYWTGQDIGRNEFFKYWYRFRPAQAEPGYVRGIDPHSPLLKIALPQDHCPPNKLQAAWASDVPKPTPYNFNRDVPGSASWDPHKGVWH